MSFHLQVVAMIVSLFFFLVSFSFIRSTSVRPFYSLLWILVGIFLLSVPIFHEFYKWLANEVFGIADTTHVITLGLLSFVLLYVLHLTLRLSKVSNEVQILLTYAALLEKRVREIERPFLIEEKGDIKES